MEPKSSKKMVKYSRAISRGRRTTYPGLETEQWRAQLFPTLFACLRSMIDTFSNATCRKARTATCLTRRPCEWAVNPISRLDCWGKCDAVYGTGTQPLRSVYCKIRQPCCICPFMDHVGWLVGFCLADYSVQCATATPYNSDKLQNKKKNPVN